MQRRISTKHRERYVGAYLQPEQKQRLVLLAQIRRKTITDLLSEMIDEATAPIAELKIEQRANA